MVDIIEMILFFLVLFLIVRLIIFITKRVLLLIRVYSLVGMCNAKVTLHTFPFRPMWMTSKLPDISVKIFNTVYLLRIYSGEGFARSVHFVNEKYSVVYTQVKGGTRRPRTHREMPSLLGGVNIGAVVNILPPMEIPKEYEGERVHFEEILLLNPAPLDLTYVTKEKTSIRIAFTGDDLYGMKVFTASTFMRYADRESRNPKPKPVDDLDYYFFDGAN